MSPSNLIRWSGLAAIGGGVILVVLPVAFFILFSGQPESVTAVTSAWKIVVGLGLVANVLTLMALMGLYARQVKETRALGLLAFVMALIGTSMMFGFSWANTFVVPVLAAEVPEFVDATQAALPLMLMIGNGLTSSLFGLGWLLFGLASFLGGVLSRGASVLLMIGAVLGIVLFFALGLLFGFTVLGAALAWMGYAVWTRAGERAAVFQPAR